MAADFKNHADRLHLSMNEEHEVGYWTERLGCSKDELAAAVATVDNSADAVRRELSRTWGYGRLPLAGEQDHQPRRRQVDDGAGLELRNVVANVRRDLRESSRILTTETIRV
jgi:hypothetical protein